MLPPSIHPDTQRAYTANLYDVLQSIPTLMPRTTLQTSQGMLEAGVMALRGSNVSATR